MGRRYHISSYQAALQMILSLLNIPEKYWVGMSSRVSLTLWGEGVILVLIDHHPNDGVTITISYGVDTLLHRLALHPAFPISLIKTYFESLDQLRLTYRDKRVTLKIHE